MQPGAHQELAQPTRSDIVELVAASHVGKLKHCRKGEVLYWQGEPAKDVFVVKRGRVRVSPISAKGKTHTYDVVGPGRLVGASALLLGGEHESMAEAFKDTEVFVLSQAEFERLLVHSPLFSMAVMKELAQMVQLLARQLEELSFLDVRPRLERCLARLADQYGVASEQGITIDLDITHQEIAEMIAANRSTVTFHLNKLKQEGLLWKQGRRLILAPPRHAEILENLKRAVVEYNEEGARSWAEMVVSEKVDPLKALDALTAGIKQVDGGFAHGDLALPDIVGASFAMKSAMSIVEGEIKRTGKKVRTLGIVVIGTVYGDIHDIGKTIVSALLTAGGFEVIDLCVNIAAEEFVEAVNKYKPDILAMSALMTMTAPELGKVINALKDQGLRDKVKIMVGGAAITQEFSERIGADGYEPTARGAVGLARRLRTDEETL